MENELNLSSLLQEVVKQSMHHKKEKNTYEEMENISKTIMLNFEGFYFNVIVAF